MLKDDTGDTDAVLKELRSAVATKIAKYAVPDQILVSGTWPSGALALCCKPPSLLPQVTANSEPFHQQQNGG